MGDASAGMEDEYDFVWDAIESGSVDVLKAVAPGDFNWRSFHPVDERTVLQTCLQKFVLRCDKEGQEQRYLDTARFLIAQGADPTQQAPDDCEYESGWNEDDIAPDQFAYAGSSTISVILRIQLGLEQADSDWQIEVDALSRLLDVLLSKSGCARSRAPKISIYEAVVDAYESTFREKESMDLIIECKGGEQSRCNSVFISRFSDVLKAMMSTNMQEGQSKKIIIPDAEAKDVDLLLEMCYCGSIADEKKPVSNLLGAIQLAHRWQIVFAVSFLESLLVEHVNDKNFEKLADTAVLIQLPSLKTKLQDHCSKSSADDAVKSPLQKKFEDGKLSGGAQQIAELVWGSSKSDSGPPKKKRRT